MLENYNIVSWGWSHMGEKRGSLLSPPFPTNKNVSPGSPLSKYAVFVVEWKNGIEVYICFNRLWTSYFPWIAVELMMAPIKSPAKTDTPTHSVTLFFSARWQEWNWYLTAYFLTNGNLYIISWGFTFVAQRGPTSSPSLYDLKPLKIRYLF